MLLRAAVGMMYFGGAFVVERANLAEGAMPVISMWAPTHGLEVLSCRQCLLLGFTVFFLARTLAAMYFVNNIRSDEGFERRMRRATLGNGLVFAVLFVLFSVVLLLSPGLRADASGNLQSEDFLYLHNLTGMWWWGICFLLGVVLALWGIAATAFTRSRGGIWFSGIGVALVIITLFAIAGYSDTAYLPSLTDPQSSLTLANSSSSLFTLKTMSIVSLLIPFVLAYIVYVWRKMNAKPLTNKDINGQSHQY